MHPLKRFTGFTKALVGAVLLVIGLLALHPGTVGAATSFYNSIAFIKTGHLVLSDTAPAIASGFGTSPSVTVSNGAASFIVNVGTGGSATTGVITMPAATTGWTCSVNDITAAAAGTADALTAQTASSTTSVTVKQRTLSTGVALAWTASDLVRLNCMGY